MFFMFVHTEYIFESETGSIASGAFRIEADIDAGCSTVTDWRLRQIRQKRTGKEMSEELRESRRVNYLFLIFHDAAVFCYQI